jgi:hypothetical protein
MGIRNLCPCDCSGTLNFQSGDTLYTANICPFCDSLGSSVTITTTEAGTFFQSTIVKPASCVTINGLTTLVASGEGIFNGEPVVFSIFLQEQSGVIDSFEINFRSANVNTGISVATVPDENLTITECPGE